MRTSNAYKRLHSTRRSGFTLVETVVASVVAMILIGLVVGILAFSARAMGYQRAQGNATTVASTVKSTIEGTLRTARGVRPDPDAAHAEGDVITFTTAQKTSYLGNKGNQYWLYIQNGQLCIANARNLVGTAPDSGNKNAGELLPAATYIDGDTISWEVSEDPQNQRILHIKINVYASQDRSNPIATATTDIESMNTL